MSTLTEHTLINGLEENLKNAIISAGGEVPEGTCLWQYPDIIEGLGTTPGISNNYTNNIQLSAEIDAPEWSGLDTLKEGTSLQDLLEDLLYKVIPSIPSVIKGDIITTDSNGLDQYAPELENYIDSLKPNTQYLRLFLVSQKDPIYISLEKLVGIDSPSIDLSDYYTTSQIDDKFKEVYNKFDSLNIPNINPDNYYTKDETNNQINDIINNLKFEVSGSDESISLENIVSKTINNESNITELIEVDKIINQTISENSVKINDMEQKINQIKGATSEDAEISFDNIFVK